MRGNRQHDALPHISARSIPARAGEPRPSRASVQPFWVYPRACGGTAFEIGGLLEAYGLSPRVRGNPVRTYTAGSSQGSIPARAGEPGSHTLCWHAEQVYPRACGGTRFTGPSQTAGRGLSPRVRGNQCAVLANAGKTRSIPARAGEPLSRPTRATLSQVYPRACGGTCFTAVTVDDGDGLSPRVRGNQFDRVFAALAQGSIPARAGEPTKRELLAGLSSVYPRACGGTDRALIEFSQNGGLSPRVRGNRLLQGLSREPPRSIPARAGEPDQ